jgi:phosphopantetheinyl transferase
VDVSVCDDNIGTIQKIDVFWLELHDELDYALLERVRKLVETETPQYVFHKDMLLHTCAVLLAIYAWKKSVGDVPLPTIVRDNNGKPRFSENESGFYFNVTHSGDIVMCVMGDSEVGADMEQVRQVPHGVAERYFDTAEQEELAKADLGKQAEVFYRIWTKKESYLKATGFGLRGIDKHMENDWICTPLSVCDGYAASVCCKGVYSVTVERVSGLDFMAFYRDVCYGKGGE